MITDDLKRLLNFLEIDIKKVDLTSTESIFADDLYINYYNENENCNEYFTSL